MINKKSANVDQKYQHLPKQEYELASLWRIFAARLFDLIIAALPSFILRFWVTIQPDHWKLLYITLGITVLITILYFVLIPYLTRGQTLGKLMVGIRLKAKDQTRPPITGLFLRELYFLFIPWVIALVCQIGAIFLMKSGVNIAEKQSMTQVRIAILLTQIGYLFYLAWFLYLGMSIKVQENHQAHVDLRYDFYVVNKTPISAKKPKSKKEPNWIPTLESQPGVLQESEKQWLAPEEYGFELEPDKTSRKGGKNEKIIE